VNTKKKKITSGLLKLKRKRREKYIAHSRKQNHKAKLQIRRMYMYSFEK
jgi:hypothetical protein